MAIDDVGGHLFVSSAKSGAVTVLDLGGTVVSTLSVPGAGRMVVSGNTLYVGTSGGTIARIDLTSLTVEAPLATGLGGQVDDLVSANGKLWAQVGQCNIGGLVLDSIDPTSGAVVSFTNRAIGLFDFCFALVASPTAPQIFIAAQGVGPLPLGRIDVSGATPTVTYQTTDSNTPTVSGFGDFAVSPDGKYLYVAAVWTANKTSYVVRRVNTSDLTFDGTVYPIGPYPNGVAVTGGNGGRVAMTAGTIGPVQAFTTSDPTTPLINQTFNTQTNSLLPRGIVFSAFGTRLFVISGETYDLDPVNRPLYVRVNIFTVP